MLKKINKSNRGFTIIEVMIVLAIAGLIILVVLLAVPALQRNARNTAIKNDASAVSSGISEYESNNNGVQPKAANASSTSPGTVTLCDATPCGANVASADVKVQPNTTVTYKGAAGAGAATATTTPGIGNIWIFSGEDCSDTANPRAMQVVYAIEASGHSTGIAKCIDV